MEQDQMSALAPQKRFNLWLIATIVLAVLLIAGGVVFAWQRSVNNKAKNDLQGQINTLQNQVQQLPKTNTSTNTTTNNDTGQVTPTTLIGIATQLVTDYLKANLLASDPGQKLLDYKINKIEIIKDEGTCFRFDATFSVKPATTDTGWLAGNGKMNSSGWIDTNLGFDATKQINGSYVLGQGFTGAASASCKNSADVTADWKTYTNNKFGYSVEYPSNWYYKDYNDVTIDNVLLSRVVFSDKTLPSDIGKMDPTQSISVWVEDRPFAEARTAFLQGPFIGSTSETTITIDNMQATKLSGVRKAGKYSSIEVMIAKNDKVYTIIGIDSPSVSAAFNQMLSTFKFTK